MRNKWYDSCDSAYGWACSEDPSELYSDWYSEIWAPTWRRIIPPPAPVFTNTIFSGQDAPYSGSLASEIAGLLGSIMPCRTDFGGPCQPVGPMGLHTDDQGYAVGDQHGEVYCSLSQGFCDVWNAFANMWVESSLVPPTYDARANALAQAINNTGVQTLQNPCTIGGFYAASAALGAGGVFLPEAAFWVLDNPLVILHGLVGGIMGGGFGTPGIGAKIAGAMATAQFLGEKAYSACYD